MKWTQQLPTKSGYYWFSEEYEDVPRVTSVDCESGAVYSHDLFTVGRFHVFTGDEGYWFSSEPIPVFGWENT